MMHGRDRTLMRLPEPTGMQAALAHMRQQQQGEQERP